MATDDIRSTVKAVQAIDPKNAVAKADSTAAAPTKNFDAVMKRIAAHATSVETLKNGAKLYHLANGREVEQVPGRSPYVTKKGTPPAATTPAAPTTAPAATTPATTTPATTTPATTAKPTTTPATTTPATTAKPTTTPATTTPVTTTPVTTTPVTTTPSTTTTTPKTTG